MEGSRGLWPLPKDHEPGPGFSRALCQRILRDLRVLPVRDADTHYVVRGNVTVYANSTGCDWHGSRTPASSVDGHAA